ncbi:MAG: guanitoxin biosynthesis heme-dependent pre-guanitoxin N-hydroxylase GntA [Candidatus Tumulicola sp.]
MNANTPLGEYTTSSPFVSAAARRFSNYSAFENDTLTRLIDRREPLPRARITDAALRAFVQSDNCSCVAAKAAVTAGGYRFGYYPGFAPSEAIEGVARDLAAFVAERPSIHSRYATFVAAFEEVGCGEERWFERNLWRILQRLHELDARHNSYNASVASDPSKPDFSFSFAGTAFFIVGMHPNASRRSRRFFMPALAFNSHDQFDTARQTGDFDRIVTAVRKRELTLQGSLNPELREFGTRSEARQYAGRATEDDWKCPFRPQQHS